MKQNKKQYIKVNNGEIRKIFKEAPRVIRTGFTRALAFPNQEIVPKAPYIEEVQINFRVLEIKET